MGRLISNAFPFRHNFSSKFCFRPRFDLTVKWYFAHFVVGNGREWELIYYYGREWEWDVFTCYYGNGMGMGIQSWEWEEIGSEKSFPHISMLVRKTYAKLRARI